MVQILQTFGIPDLVAILSGITVPFILVIDLWVFFPSFFTLDLEKRLRFALSIPITLSVFFGYFYTVKLYFDFRAEGNPPSYQSLLLALNYTAGLALIYIAIFVPYLYASIFVIDKFANILKQFSTTAEKSGKILLATLLIAMSAPVFLLAHFLARNKWITLFLFGKTIKYWETVNISTIFSADYPIRLTVTINRLTSSLGIQGNISGTIVLVSTTLGVVVSAINIIEHFSGAKEKAPDKDDDIDSDRIPDADTFESSSYPDDLDYHPFKEDEMDIDDDDLIDDYKGVPRTLTDIELKIFLEQQKNKKDKAM